MTIAPSRTPLAHRLPGFPWDSLSPVIERAQAHPGGSVDLSIGSPVDPVPESVVEAIHAHADYPGYPPALGLPELRDAIASASQRRYGIDDVATDSIIPAVGTKELIASLPWMLGIGSPHSVAIPTVAYPTYDVAARLCGARTACADTVEELEEAAPALVYLNSPSNPTGRVAGASELRHIVSWARQRGVIVVSDECYLGLDYSGTARSILHPDVCGGSHDGLIAIHSLSKTANLASYRVGWAFGDPALLRDVAEVRKHCGVCIPWPIQHAAIAALGDVGAEEEQHRRYARRHEMLGAALRGAGFTVLHSEAGLYFWVQRDGATADEVLTWFAERGVIAAPGYFYGDTDECQRSVRLSITASDDAIAEAAHRLGAET